jgi:hypothetical protein
VETSLSEFARLLIINEAKLVEDFLAADNSFKPFYVGMMTGKLHDYVESNAALTIALAPHGYSELIREFKLQKRLITIEKVLKHIKKGGS